MIWATLLLLTVFAAPFLREAFKPAMTDARRRSAPGDFATLGQGLTHFQLAGPPDAPLVVLVHGLTTPSFVWTALTRDLTAAGYRTLSYDLFGRGYSDRPGGRQDSAFFHRQLDDLLEHLKIEEPFHLVGYSMGGAIAAGYAAAHPDRVTRLALIAPAGLHRPDSPTIRFLRDRGLLGTWAMLALYPRQMRKGVQAERDLISAVPGITDLQLGELRLRGFVPAVLASLRGILAQPLEAVHLKLQNEGLPVLAIWGADDAVIPSSAMGQLAAWNTHAVHEVIADAGHGLTYTHAGAVSDRLLAFLPRPT